MNKLIIVIGLVLNFSLCLSQNTLFDRHYEFGTWTRGWSIVNLEDTAFIVAGTNDILLNGFDNYSAILVKTDANGDTLASQHYLTTDTVFQNQFNANSDDFFYSIAKTPDNNFVVLGSTQSYGATNQYDFDILLIKFNSNLDTLWSKVISHPSDTTFRPNQIISTSDGGYLICGWQNSFVSNNARAFLCKVDSVGNFLWHKSYSNLFYTSVIFGVSETSDHGFICTGGVYDASYEGDPLYFKVDSVGNFLWAQTQNTPYSDWNRNIIKTLDGNYFIDGLGSTGTPTFRQHRFQKITEAGIVLWDKSYGSFSTGTPLGILQNPDSSYIMAGANGVGSGSQGILMKMDANGDSLWSRYFGTLMDYGWFWDIAPCSDGGYVMCGETYCCNFTPGVGNTSSMWLVRTDSLGLLTGFNELVDVEPNSILGLPYPNPAKDYFEVNITTPDTQLPEKSRKGVELLLFDNIGKQIASQTLPRGTDKARFEMSKFASGTYLVVISIDGYNAGSRRIVKL